MHKNESMGIEIYKCMYICIKLLVKNLVLLYRKILELKDL